MNNERIGKRKSYFEIPFQRLPEVLLTPPKIHLKVGSSIIAHNDLVPKDVKLTREVPQPFSQQILVLGTKVTYINSQNSLGLSPNHITPYKMRVFPL